MQKKFLQFIFSILLIGGGFFAYSHQAHAGQLRQNIEDTTMGYAGSPSVYYIHLESTDLPGNPTGRVNSMTVNHVQTIGSCGAMDYQMVAHTKGSPGFDVLSDTASISSVSSSTPTFVFDSDPTKYGSGFINIEDISYMFLYAATSSPGCVWGDEIFTGTRHTYPTGWATSTATTYTQANCNPFCDAVQVGGSYYGMIAFTMDGAFGTSVGITSPTEFSTVQNNTTLTVTGYCPTNGENQIAITTDNPVRDPVSYAYTVDCNSNTFTAQLSIGSSSNYCISAIDYTSGDVSASTCIFANRTGVATGSNIYFMSPPMFDNGYTGSDFKTWQIGIGLPPASGVTSFYYTVRYGTSTSSPSYTDSLLDQVGRLPVSPSEQTDGSQQQNLPLNKLNATASSTIYAIAYLYDQNNATIASSTLLTLHFDSGTTTPYADNSQSGGTNRINCAPSDFGFTIPSLSPVVNSPYFDIGQGFCKLYVTTLVPDESDFTQFSDLWTTIKAKPPFGYFTKSQDTLSGFNTSTPATYNLPSVNGISFFRNLVDNALAFLVVLSFLLFMFHRFRLFNFHV